MAVLGSDSFDVADVDVTTLAFGPDGAAPAFDLTNPLIYWLSHWDVNRDGLADLLVHFRTQPVDQGVGEIEGRRGPIRSEGQCGHVHVGDVEAVGAEDGHRADDPAGGVDGVGVATWLDVDGNLDEHPGQVARQRLRVDRVEHTVSE